MFGKIRGTASFKAQGAKIYSFINSIRENGIACTSQRCRNGCFYGQIYMTDMHNISDLAEENGIELDFTEKKGFPFKLKGYRFRFGIILGILIMFSFVFYLSNIVVSVEVCGNIGVSREQIISALSDIGIYKGKFIADIDFRKCEQRLRLSIPDIAWTGIRHTGSRIVVDVTEADPPPEMVRDDIPCNIIADRDAEIESAEVYSGRLMKKAGEGVKKGDILISGVVDDGGGHTLKKHAMGKIIGVYEESVSFSQPLSTEGQIFTGEQTTKKYFDFFGFRIPMFFRDADFQTYDYTETSNSFMFLGKKLPLGIIHSTYTPFEYKMLSYSSEEADILLQQQLSVYEKNFYDSKGITVKERNIDVKSFEDRMEYNVNFVLEGEIGYDFEIYVD